MYLYFGLWPLYGFIIPILYGVIQFAYFHLWHFPRVIMQRPSEIVREATTQWEMMMMFYDSAGTTAIRVSRFEVVNELLSTLHLCVRFSWQESLPFMLVGSVFGFVAQNMYLILA